MKYFRWILVLVSLTLAGEAFAQTTSGSMSGTVIDSQKQVVPVADVVITNEQSQEPRCTVTDASVAFACQPDQPGPYTIRPELAGFGPIEFRANQVLANSRLAVPTLRREIGTLAEAVTVSAVGEAVATTTTAHQAILD